MYNNSFYGGQKGADIKLVHTFPYLKSNDNKGMLDDLSQGYASNINLGDYVMISYGKDDSTAYINNASIDGNNNFNSSIWEKVFLENGPQYHVNGTDAPSGSDYYAKSGAGWNYKFITQFVNKFENTSSIVANYDFYTSSMFFEGELNAANICDNKLQDVSTILNISHSDIRTDQIIGVNHYIHPGYSEVSGNYGFQIIYDDSKYIIKNTSGRQYYAYFGMLIGLQLLTDGEEQQLGDLSQPIDVYFGEDNTTSNTKYALRATITLQNDTLSVQIYDNEGFVSPKINSYWYFKSADGNWGRVQVNSNEGDYLNSRVDGATAKAYSASYINSLIAETVSDDEKQYKTYNARKIDEKISETAKKWENMSWDDLYEFCCKRKNGEISREEFYNVVQIENTKDVIFNFPYTKNSDENVQADNKFKGLYIFTMEVVDIENSAIDDLESNEDIPNYNEIKGTIIFQFKNALPYSFLADNAWLSRGDKYFYSPTQLKISTIANREAEGGDGLSTINLVLPHAYWDMFELGTQLSTLYSACSIKNYIRPLYKATATLKIEEKSHPNNEFKYPTCDRFINLADIGMSGNNSIISFGWEYMWLPSEFEVYGNIEAEYGGDDYTSHNRLPYSALGSNMPESTIYNVDSLASTATTHRPQGQDNNGNIVLALKPFKKYCSTNKSNQDDKRKKRNVNQEPAQWLLRSPAKSEESFSEHGYGCILDTGKFSIIEQGDQTHIAPCFAFGPTFFVSTQNIHTSDYWLSNKNKCDYYEYTNQQHETLE